MFSHPDNVWMIRVIERRRWKAQGRVARSRQCWDLEANHDALPTTLRRSYDHDVNALLKVTHEMIVYVVRKNAPKIVLATTQPIPVQIVTSSWGGDS